jgi:hypothetical protein
VSDARTRLPREPYPGLRPFLDFEAALLFGRERQVREVVERLRLTQFVAVLGGSGSGKSSLIHAGVVPELRSFGIPGAGDLWLPLTCTPGTNVSAEDSAARRHSPITRLARRFAGLLKSRGAEAADAARLHEIAEVFRQEAGFARLLDTYAAELAVPPGPDPSEARVLFVLDQFEEIFHPTNKGVEDARLLVERVLDHFFNPHPHCHVVLTMRSEHLNDCAGFLELPDAINKSSYLIRRLDDSELREAITGPAQRFLRLVARSNEASASPRELPAEVKFEPAVLDRVLRDVKSITHDPDHLPLLQHLLARLWEAALEREEMDVPVPSNVTEIDLVRAVAGGRSGVPGDEQPLGEGVNTLRECVENWPESIYRWHDAPQRVQLDALLRHLAFKDPNTGLYSQQRIDVDACAHLLGADKTRADLRALIAEGYLGSVDYLFWDEEDPARVTLKVSHEAFIRGWSRFRQLVDAESLRFDGFVGVLRKCADWVANGRHEDFLLEAGEMRRLRESDFESHLAQPEQRAVWFRFLLLDRDGARLCKLEPQLDAFWATSSQRLRERERQQGRARRNWLLFGATTLLLLPSALFSILIQEPVTQRAELLFDAGNRANRAPLTPDYPGIGAAAAPLQSLLRAAGLIDLARSGQGSVTARISEGLFKRFSWIPQVHRQDAFLTGVAAQAEPPVNGKLRQLLATALWRGAPAAAGESRIEPAETLDLACAQAVQDAGTPEPLPGRLYVAAAGSGGPSAGRRAIFVPTPVAGRDTALALHGARWDAPGLRCELGPVALKIPLELDPHIVIDAGLRYFAYSAEGRSVEVPSVTLHEIDWERNEDDVRRFVQSEARTVVTDAVAVARVRQATGGERVALVESWRTPGGRSFAVGGEVWRLVAPSAQRLPVGADDAAFVQLRRSAEGALCRRIPLGWAAQPGFSSEMFEDGSHCYAITRGNPPAAPGATVATLREQVMVAVYEEPDADALAHLDDNPPAPIASLAPFARVERGAADWRVGTAGAYEGWLALRAPDARGQPRLLGVPWSTCALWRLGRELMQPDPAQAALAADAAEAHVCGGDAGRTAATVRP